MKTLYFLLFICNCFLGFSQSLTQLQKVVAKDRASGDQFGGSVAISGNYAIIGAYSESEDTSGINTLSFAGAAYIFEKNSNGRWFQKQKLVPSDRAAQDYFGASVAIDSHRIVIGAYEKNSYGSIAYTHAGAIYVFERDANGIWNEKQKLVASDTSIKSHFGFTVGISGDYIVAGAPLEHEDSLAQNTLPNSGAAYIFERNTGNGNWNQVKKIVASDRDSTDFYGIAVSVAGNSIFVGANREDHDSVGLNKISDAGSVYIYTRNGNGLWLQTQKITASSRAASDRFGSNLSSDENLLIVGVSLEDEDAANTNTKLNAGAVYIFKKQLNGMWLQHQKIVSNDRTANDYFGISTQINKNTIVVGAEQESEDINGGNTVSLAGSAYIFKKDINDIWHQTQKIVASDRGVVDLFGHAVAVSDSTILVGAYAEDEDVNGGNSLNGSGSAYFFEPCYATNFSKFDTACASYVSPSGNYTWYNSGIYNDTIINARGCDSILTINLHIKTVDTSVTLSGALLTSGAINSVYQWVDCNNGYTPISGANNQTYTATYFGSFAVIVTTNGCTDTSYCHSNTAVGINKHSIDNQILIFPNPSNGVVYIKNAKKDSEVSIIDIFGKQIYSEKLNEENSINLKLAKGIYFVAIYSDDYKYFEKLIVQ